MRYVMNLSQKGGLRLFSAVFGARPAKTSQFFEDMVNGNTNLFSLSIYMELNIMKTTLLAAATVLVSFAAPAMAWEGKVIQCFDKVWVAAEYKVSKKLHTPAYTKWEHRGDQLAEVYYAAIYLEQKHLVRAGHYLKVKAACNK